MISVVAIQFTFLLGILINMNNTKKILHKSLTAKFIAIGITGSYLFIISKIFLIIIYYDTLLSIATFVYILLMIVAIFYLMLKK